MNTAGVKNTVNNFLARYKLGAVKNLFGPLSGGEQNTSAERAWKILKHYNKPSKSYMNTRSWNAAAKNMNSYNLSNNQKNIVRLANALVKTGKPRGGGDRHRLHKDTFNRFKARKLTGNALVTQMKRNSNARGGYKGRAIGKAALVGAAGAAAAYGGHHLIKFAQSPRGRAIVMATVKKAKQYLLSVKNTPKGESPPAPSTNLAVNIAELGGPTAVREMYENGLLSNINFSNSNARQGLRNLQNASAIQLAGAAGGAAIMATGGGGAGAAAASLTRRGATGNGLRQAQLQAERVAAVRRAAANATRKAIQQRVPNSLKAKMIKNAITNASTKQGMTFGEGVQAMRRMTNTTRAAVNRQRMRMK